MCKECEKVKAKIKEQEGYLNDWYVRYYELKAAYEKICGAYCKDLEMGKQC
jgi:hypothetical protein